MRPRRFLSILTLIATTASVSPAVHAEAAANVLPAGQELFIHTDGPLGDAAASLRLESDTPAGCDVEFGVAAKGRVNTPTYQFAMIEDQSGLRTAFSRSDGGGIVHVGASGTLNTVSPNPDWWLAILLEDRVGVNGYVDLTAFSTNVHHFPPEMMERLEPGTHLGLHSFSFQVICDADITWSVRGARETLLIEPRRSDRGGVYAWGLGIGSANIGISGSETFTAPEVRLRSVSFTFQAGLLKHQGPEGEDLYLLPFSGTGAWFVADSFGPGEHSLSLDHAALGGSLFVLLAGYRELVSLDDM